MSPSRRFSLISAITRGRLAGECISPRPLPPILKMRTIVVDKRVKTTIIHAS
jgi:hypothetical protein